MPRRETDVTFQPSKSGDRLSGIAAILLAALIVLISGCKTGDDSSVALQGPGMPPDASPGCGPGTVECGNNGCVDLGTDGANCGACGNACPSGQACTMGKCAATCQAGSIVCGNACTDPKTDNGNCGACGNVCPAGNVCSAGTCALSCQAGLTECN